MFRYLTTKPAAPLSRLVQTYWILEDDSLAGVGRFERVLPDGCGEIVIHSGERFRQEQDGAITLQPRSLFVGQMSTQIRLEPVGRSAMLGVRFYPGGMHRLFGLSINESRDRVVPLDFLIGSWTRELEDRITTDCDIAAVIGLLETHLLRLLEYARDEDRTVAATLTRLRFGSKDVRVAETARELGISERQLERRFQRVVGLSPRTFHRLQRFRSVIRYWTLQPQAALAATAYDCGYADQSHFQREFRAFAGITPGAYRREIHQLSDHFTTGTMSESFNTDARSRD